tara:strand:+ start:161 stop:502 length:342 start_codon:yes stop_codon:yes gene_type:complete
MSVDNQIDSMIREEYIEQRNNMLRRQNQMDTLELWLSDNESVHGDFLVYCDENTLAQWSRRMYKEYGEGKKIGYLINNDHFAFLSSEQIFKAVKGGYTFETEGGDTFWIDKEY